MSVIPTVVEPGTGTGRTARPYSKTGGSGPSLLLVAWTPRIALLYLSLSLSSFCPIDYTSLCLYIDCYYKYMLQASVEGIGQSLKGPKVRQVKLWSKTSG